MAWLIEEYGMSGNGKQRPPKDENPVDPKDESK